MIAFMVTWWLSKGWRCDFWWFTSDEYQQDGDGVVVKTVVTVGVGWDQTGWRKISAFERQQIFNSISPQKISPKSIDRWWYRKKWAIQTFDRYARGRYTICKSIGKKSGGEIFDRAMIPNQKAKKMQSNSSLVERSSECQDTFLVEVAALRSFIDAKAFKCNSPPHCNVIERHCTIRAIRSFKACKNLIPSQCTKTLVGWLPPSTYNGLLASS